ncbi:MAG: hypothetical protein QOJ99_4291 [Bryobacterales bacterium]|nr:hypothetical protein [Bryobacterales bacterium]
MDTAGLPVRSRLEENASANVCIVGAGISGLSTAYMLARAGRSVIVLDDGEIGGGETSRTTAHLSNALDDRYFELERLHGEKGARLAAESHAAAIDQIEAIVKAEAIGCDFERLDGYLFNPPEGDPGTLDQELEAAHRSGLTGVERVARAPLDWFDTGPSLRFPRQAQFHPMRYLEGLARAFEQRGGRIFTGTHVNEIKGGAQAGVKTDEGREVKAGSIVVATNTPVNDMVTIHTKQHAYRTYVVGMRVPRGSVTSALFWDTLDPYHYVRLQSEGDSHVLIVGGEDHKTGQADDTEERFDRLAAWTRERFPMAKDQIFSWSGQVMEPVDGMAFIGRNPGDETNVYIATGDSGHGMTHGTIAGLLLTDLILGRQNEWASLYDPSRISMRSASEFAAENLNVAAQYADLVTGGDVASAEQVAVGSGAVLRRGLKKIAVYRDEQRQVHEFSAICPHLGCVVAWNPAEKSWDCPCHGSRFDPMGNVLNGPALTGLSPAE